MRCTVCDLHLPVESKNPIIRIAFFFFLAHCLSWMGTECEIFWLTYFSPAYLLVVIVLSVLVIIKLGRNKCTRFIRRVREHRLFRPRFKPGAKPDAGPNANNDANGSASGEKGVLSDGSASNGGSGSSSKSTGASNGAKSPPIANGAGKNV